MFLDTWLRHFIKCLKVSKGLKMLILELLPQDGIKFDLDTTDTLEAFSIKLPYRVQFLTYILPIGKLSKLSIVSKKDIVTY